MTSPNTSQLLKCRGCGIYHNGRRGKGHGYCLTCRTKVVYDGYTREQLSEAFDQVKDLTNWKSPIDHTFRGFLSESEFRRFDAAIVFYTGSKPVFELEDDTTRVTAPGYYQSVGA